MSLELKLILPRILQIITSLIAYVDNVAYNAQEATDDINYNKVHVYDSGLVCINTQTNQSNAEDNSTHNIINVIKHYKVIESTSERKYSVVFKLKQKEDIIIRMKEGDAFLFLGKLLTHGQTCNIFGKGCYLCQLYFLDKRLQKVNHNKNMKINRNIFCELMSYFFPS